MAKFNIKGKPSQISMREVKALLHGADVVLGVMGFSNPYQWVTVNLVSQKTLGDSAGDCNGSTIRLLANYNWSETATLIIHELIHCYVGTSDEWLTSTVTAKIKAEVVEVAWYIFERSQRWAAIKAHMSISYNNGDPDEYNKEQYHKDHKGPAGRAYRRGKK